MKHVAPILLVLFASCGEPKVIREGAGWRETESAVEVTTSDPKLLAEIARTHPDPRLRALALAKVSDPAVLADVARNEKEPSLRKKAVEGLDDEALLDQISKNDADPGVKEAAAVRRDVLRIVGAGHPEYRGWAAAKPGSWVRMRIEVRIQNWKQTTEIERKLSACRPDRAVMEQRDRATGKGVQGIFKEVLANYDLAVGSTDEGDGDLEIGGKRAKCRWTRWNFSRLREIVHVQRWFHEPIPGGIARITMEIAPEGDPQRVVQLWVTGWGN
jgi:hypothetical protein